MILLKNLKRLLTKTQWCNLRNINPISKTFGLDRGTPIDRYYIEQFLKNNSQLIQGRFLEVGDDSYIKKFGHNISKAEVLHIDQSNPKATIIGDLTNQESLPKAVMDGFICTQTLNFIYEFKTAIQGIHRVLKPGGVALVTVAGLCQISQYDMDRWGDYWRFTNLSIGKAFKDVFGVDNVEVTTYGNVLSAVSLMEGIAAEELTAQELDYQDKVYQIVIALKAQKT